MDRVFIIEYLGSILVSCTLFKVWRLKWEEYEFHTV